MACLLAAIIFTVAVGCVGLPFDENDPLNGDARYPADLGWLFEGNNNPTTQRDLNQNVCDTDECKKIARVWTESINDSVDPCENFYEYACGNWAQNNPIPKDKAVWNLMYIIGEKVENQILDILKTDPKQDDIIPLKIARKLYFSCMDIDGMDRRGLEPLVITLARGNGWPMIMLPEEWDEAQTNWQKVDHYYAHLTGSFTFFYLSIYPDANTTNYYASITPVSEPVGSSILNDDEEDRDPDQAEQENSTEKSSDEKNSTEADEKSDEDKDLKDGDSDNGVENADKENEEENSVEAAHRNSFRGRYENSKNVTREEKRAAYRKFVVDVTLAIAKARGFPVSEEMIAQDVDDLINFITELYKIKKSVWKTESEDTFMSISEIQEWYDDLNHNFSTSKIKWLNTLNIVFNDANVEIDEDLVVYFPRKNYFEHLADLLGKTSARTLVNYVHWKVICKVLDATTIEMRQLLDGVKEFGREAEEHSEKEKVQLRKNRCLRQVNTESIVGYEYVKRHFNDELIELTREMVKEIQNEVEKQILQSEWMDNNTRTHALTKVKNMNTLVGYPEWYKNATAVNNFYKGVVVSPSYFENLLTHEKRFKWKILRHVNQKQDNAIEQIGIDNPAEVNAFYTGIKNTIIITAADLQGPLLETSRPAMINFGIIGLIIGHEINHGFDSNNFKYDAKGAEALSIMADAYNQRAGCFVEQYNNFTENMELFNGTVEDYGNQTAGENIADSMGLSAVYHAFKNREKKNGKPEQTLPGFENFSNDQLFFLSFANMWCESINLEKARKVFRRDSHSPGMLRVLGPLQNSVEFANAYNCPVGSTMNPAKKCNIWK